MLARIAPLQLGGAIALLVVTVACGDARSSAAGAPTDGSSSSGGADAGGAAGATSATDAESGAPGLEGGSPTVSPGERCSTDQECDDGVFCNGREVCADLPDSDYRVCQVPELGPCPAQNCDEELRRCDCSDEHADADGDGFKAAGCVPSGQRPDCDDDDATRYPTNSEECDLAEPTHDEDCDSSTFVGHDGDDDNDGYVNSACANFRGYQPSRNLGDERLKHGAGSDCNDDAEEGRGVHPGAEEECDGIDNNCNGVRDEATGAPLSRLKAYFRDRDGDSFGSENEDDTLQSLCNLPPPGYVQIAGDCDDTNGHVAPSRAEVCNGIDDDCDEIVDQPLAPGTLMFDEPFDGVTTFECVPKKPDSAEWVVAACPEGRRDCDDRYSNACEVPDTTLCNCHGCGNVCSFSCGAVGCEEIRGGSTGYLHTCFLVRADAGDSPDAGAAGSVACAGRNSSGQLGVGTNQDSSIARTVPLPEPVTQVASGVHHSCAVGVSGSIYCWGLNDSNQLGGASADTSNLPSEVRPLFDFGPGGPVALHAKQIAVGSEFSCAIYEQGRVACWGTGEEGQLGSGSSGAGYTQRYPFPVEVLGEALSGASQVVVGTAHACALVAGAVLCWGSNDTGQLGVSTDTLSLSDEPIPVPGLAQVSVEEIVAAGSHSCARVGGQVLCWGAMSTDYEDAHAVTPIQLPDEARALVAGIEFSCALLRSRTIACWGSTPFGEGGAADLEDEIAALPLTNVTQLFAGPGEHLCAARTDGSTWCFGPNQWGQLANGSDTEALAPVQSLFGSKPCLH